MATSRVQGGASASPTPAAPSVHRNPYRCRATAGIEAYQTSPGVATEVQKWEITIYINPLYWWKDNTEVPLLVVLARHPGNTGAVGTGILERGADSQEDSKQTRY